MNTYLPINTLIPCPEIEQVFLIEEANQRYGNNRSPFVSLTLKDMTGRLKCMIFNTKISPPLEAGKFILIKGRVESFASHLQIVAESWQPFNGSPDNLSDYVICPNLNVLKVYGERLQSYVDSMTDADYRNIVGNGCERMSLVDKMSYAPYGLSGPLSYRGGLLFHTTQLLRVSLSILDAFEDCQHGLNRDLLIAGCIFRNIGWWPCTTAKGDIFTPSPIYNALGVRFASAMVANHVCISTESDLHIKLELDKKLGIQHIAFADTHTPAELSSEAALIIGAERIVDSTELKI
jgi:hypothetical protein